ncbi:MAG TPA: carboxylating nicotinate-nucleotide diphosphorylase [Candidatus Krumholzibacteria bacterium]|nr:carboxylating nicotinate-nucleotide diphosphorylase [Candidatus Krumholzibacteria bacterium]
MTGLEPLDAGSVAAFVERALAEDAARDDATVAYLDLAGGEVDAEIRGSQDLRVAGIGVAREVFRQLDPGVTFDARVADGDRVVDGTVLVVLRGSARTIVQGERTALNFVQRMSGVATLAGRYVAAVEGTGVTILDTRKTAPLWRELDKYAVRCGGASNHRRDLHAMVLIKDNHVRAVGGVQAVLRRIADAPPAKFVELEVDSPAFLGALLESPALAHVHRVMLDNFTPAQVGAALVAIEPRREAGRDQRLEVEVSGGITLDTVRSFALRGVDFISVGALTHSAPAASMSLEVL